MINLRDTLLELADAFKAESEQHGGRSLARVATIVVNRGAFFDRLRDGKTCNLTSFEAMVAWFAQAENWPQKVIPASAGEILDRLPLKSCVPAEAE